MVLLLNKLNSRGTIWRIQIMGHPLSMSRYFWPILTPLPLLHFVTHPGRSGPPESTSHISDAPIFSRPSTNIPDKSPLYKFYLNCSRRFCPGWFCPFPLLSQYICYNRKLNITLNFMFHMIKICISVTSHAYVTNVTPSRTPSSLERDVLYGRPLTEKVCFSLSALTFKNKQLFVRLL